VLASPVFLMQHLGLNEHQFGAMFIPTVCGMVLGSWIARHTAGKYAPHKVVRFAYAWMAGAVLLNIGICWYLPPDPWTHILPIALYNIGMAMAMPILSIAGLDRMPRLRGTAASGQAFMQMLLAAVSAGLIIPLIWDHPLGLAFGMLGYLLLGWLCTRKSVAWQPAAERS
jgi:DHA1 family bicyclomycin/chloramphenicol resistance-like MFS transporter